MNHKIAKINRQETARKLLQIEIEKLPPKEQEIVERFISRRHISRDVISEFNEQLSFGERVADRVAAFGGSWTFIIIFLAFLVAWMIFNTFVLMQRAYDPYPYILLNLLLSCIAALQAPVIMMSQNRMAAKDREQATHDYEVNIKAELEILQLHEQLTELRERDWITLIDMQQKQIELLERLLSEADARQQTR